MIGGGPSGCEVVGNALRRLRLRGGRSRVALVTGSSGLLSGFPERARRLMARWLDLSGVEVRSAARVVRLAEHEAGAAAWAPCAIGTIKTPFTEPDQAPRQGAQRALRRTSTSGGWSRSTFTHLGGVAS